VICELVKARIEFKITTFFTNTLRVPYLSDIVYSSTLYRIRSTPTPLLFHDQSSSCHENTDSVREACLLCRGRNTWNQIPLHTRNLHCVPAFRKALKTHLFSRQHTVLHCRSLLAMYAEHCTATVFVLYCKAYNNALSENRCDAIQCIASPVFRQSIVLIRFFCCFPGGGVLHACHNCGAHATMQAKY